MLCNKVIQLYCEKFLLNFTGIVALDYRKIVRKFRAKNFHSVGNFLLKILNKFCTEKKIVFFFSTVQIS